jgi:putative transposase
MAAEFEKVSERRIRELISQGKISARKSKCAKGGQSGRQWLIDPGSLSTPARVRWQRRIAATAEMSAKEEEPAASLPVPGTANNVQRRSALMGNGAVNPAAYKDVAGAEAFKNEMIKAKYKYDIVSEAKIIIASKENKTERIKALAEKAGVNAATIYRWIKESEAGIYSLLRKRPTVVEGKSFRSISKEVETVIKNFYQAPGAPKAAAAYRKTVKFCEETGLEIPSRPTVFRFIAHLEETEPDICCFTRRGKEAWLEKYAPHGIRAEPERVMHIVMGDHHKLDRFIEYGGKPVRPWLTMWFDVKSRCPVGWTVSVQANGETIALALRHMMTPKKRKKTMPDGQIIEETLELGGFPETLYIDNGEDYKSRLKKGLALKEFAMLPESLDLCAHLGVKTVFATPYRPQAKAHIERFFGTLAGQFSPEHISWCGANPGERIAGYDEHKLLKQGKLQTLFELAEELDDWILNLYLETVHTSIQEKPLVAHLAGSGEKARQGWPVTEDLDILLHVKEKAMVYKEGIRRFNRLYWHNALDALAGQNVIIRYDPGHIGELRIFTLKGGFICTATNAELMKYDACKEDIKKINKRRKQRKLEITERLMETEQDFETIKVVAQKRQASGERIISGPAGNTKGLMPAITPLSKAGRKISEEKSKRQKDTEIKGLPQPQNKINPIDAMILGMTV